MTKKTRAVHPQQPVVQVVTEATRPQNPFRSGVPVLDCPCGAQPQVVLSDQWGFVVRCGQCKKEGPLGKNRYEAKMEWNQWAILNKNNTAG